MAETEAVATGEDLNMSAGATVSDPNTTFAEQCHLSYLIPLETGAEPEDIFKNIDIESGRPVADSIKQRDSLFFDETVDVLLILKAPWLGEKAFQSQMNRLVLSVEAQIVNSNISGRSSPPASDTIFTGTVQDVSDPFILVDEEESDSEDEASQYVYAAWKLPVFLARPRMRLQSPSVVFTASAGLKPDLKAELAFGGCGYLPSGMPSGLNLLESFRNDPALNGVKPRLSALRVSRVSPLTRKQDHTRHIKALQQIGLKIHPVVHTRVRFSRPNTTPVGPALIAILEVDFTSYFDCEVTLDKVHLSAPDCSIQCLTGEAMQLPLSCVAHDHVTFLYHITPFEADTMGKGSTRELDISITGTAQLIPQKCTPRLVMAWTATADFTTPVNPGFGPTPGSGSLQRSHRPSQLSIGSGQAVSSFKSPSITRPDALPALETATARTDTSLPDLGITMSFTAPSEPVRVGDTFSWAVYAVNRSSEKATRPSRKFAIVAIPRRRRNEVRAARPPSSSSRRRGNPGGEKEAADAVLDENVLHAMQKNSVVGSTDVVCLSADARIGPLAPGACHVVELQFLALNEGLVGVDAIRVIDLTSQEHVDVHNLPTMIVEPAPV